jgi:hypothetical protein
MTEVCGRFRPKDGIYDEPAAPSVSNETGTKAFSGTSNYDRRMNEPASAAFVLLEAECDFPDTYLTLKARWLIAYGRIC